MIEVSRQFPELMSGVQRAVSRAFPIESVGHRMTVTDLRWEDFGPEIKDNIALHKDYKLKGKTLAAKLRGTVEIRTKDGKIVDRAKDFILVVLPHITARSSYIVNGHEVQTVNQLRLKPGPYTRFTVSNDTETFINAAGGGYRVVFERLSGKILIRTGTSNIPLYPILKSLGITDREMSHAWGDEVFAVNQKLDKEDALPKLYQKMRQFSEVPAGADLAAAVDAFFRSKKLDPRISKITLGKEFDQISPQLLLESSRKAVDLANGNAQMDDTESLAFKSIHSVEDMVPEKIERAVPALQREIAYKMDKDPQVTRLLSPVSFSSPVLSWFETSEFTRYSDQNNPIDMASTVNLTTTMGEGGIQSTHAVKDELRLVHPSHMGFLDPVHSPEGCHAEGTDVMTDRGWVPWPLVSSETRFACLLDDGRLEYHPPEELQKYRYSGPMFGFRSETIEYLVTPNHRMWCRTDDPRSGQNGNRRLRSPKAMYRFETAESIHGKRRKVMCGGHLPYEGKQRDRSGKQLRDYLSQFGKSRTKFIPEEAFEWPEKARRALLDTLMKGDGRKARNGWNNTAYCTNSPRLAKDVERLCFGLGISVRMTLGQKAKSPKHADMWEVRLHSRTERNVAPRLRAFKSKQYIKKYDGFVYCATVPGGRLYCRFNGKGGCWYGNSKIGITGHLALGADKRGTSLIIHLYDAKTGQIVTRTPQDIETAVIAFNDQYDMTGKRPRPKTASVKAKVGYKIEIIPAAKVEYIFKDPKGFFSIVTNAIPFLHNNSPNRVLMADRHIEQSVALKDPDVPRVQSRFSGNIGYNDFFGQSFCARSPVDGTVTKVTKDQILVKGSGGVHTVYIHDYYPLNADAFLHDIPLVKVGDKVKKGQTLVENNFTKDKALSFMKYLNTGYVAYKGYNYEDGVVISESAAKKLTSVHKHDLKLDKTSTMKVGLKIWSAHYPEKAAAVDRTKYDTDGFVKKGAEIVTGMPVIPAVDQVKIDEEMAYAKLHKSLANPWRDCTMYWEESATGVVIDVIKTVGFVRIIIKTEEPAQIGDKVSNSGGGKGIIVHILPDNEMLQGENGKPLDLLFNPGCYDAATEILTVDGWRPFSAIKKGDMVLGKDPKTGRILEESVKETFVYDYCGPMYRIQNKALDLLVTPNHRMWTRKWKLGKWGFNEAQGIFGERRFYDRTGSWISDKEPLKITLFEKELAAWNDRPGHRQRGSRPKVVSVAYHDWVSFLGYFVTEGWTAEWKPGYTYRVSICQSERAHPEVVAHIDKIIERLPFVFNRHVDNDGMVKWQTSNKALFDWLRANCGCRSGDKHLPIDLLRTASPDTLKKLIGILIETDGNTRWDRETCHHGSLRYFSTSKLLMDQVQEIALKVGLVGNIKEEPDRSDGRHAVKYTIALSKMTHPRVNWCDRTKEAQVERWEHYSGKVYCVEVPNHLVFVRRNGKPVWCGNSVAGRVNPGQLYEGAAAKIAEKTGKKYLVDSFSNQSSLQRIKDDLKANGLKDTESVTDPVTGNVIDNVFVAPVPFFKLKHQVRHKFSVKGIGPYTSEQQPAKISGESAQNIGTGELYALMAGGSTHFLRDVAQIKSQSNPEYWRAVQTGMPLPPPKAPYILDKFITYLEGAGAHVMQDGHNLKVLPMTDKEVMSRSQGAITSPGVVRATDLRPETGGLFDRAVTGGFGGSSWTHIDLESPMPNPLMERPIVVLTGLKPAEFKQIMAGNLFVTKTGQLTTDHTQGKGAGAGLKILLDRIDVGKDLTLTNAQIRTAKADMLDVLNKKRRYLEALKTSGLAPSEAYIQTKIPVIPPALRPIYPLPDGALNVADANHSYREILMINNQLAGLKRQGVDDKNLAGLRADLYGALQGMSGVTEPLTRGANFKGFIATIKGRQNKYGLFQGKVVKRPQDLSARSTAIPNPKFGLDTIGLPEEMAFTIYRPFIVRRLVNAGIAPMTAGDMIDKQDPRALAALQEEIKERPVYMNRAPTLHKFGLMAFKPVLVKGKAIHTNPLINAGFNLDFDGDTLGIHVPVSEEARREALTKMPSNHLMSVTGYGVMHAPSREYALGLYLMTYPKGEPVMAKSVLEMLSKYQNKVIKVNTPVVIGGKTWTAGQALVNDALPSGAKIDNVVVDKKVLQELLRTVGREHKKEAGDVISKLKDLGAHYVTEVGYSIGLDDLSVDYKKRDAILADAAKQSKTVGFDKAYTDAVGKIQDLVKDHKDNRFVVSNIISGAFGKSDQVAQMVATPVAMAGHRGEIIKVPITKSFAEGHDIASYWATIPGSRKGLMEKGLGTQDVGALSKRLVNTTIQMVISESDCGTQNGVDFPVDSREALDRVIATGPNKGKVLTPEMARSFKSKGMATIKMRSPLKCVSTRGVCQKCYGLSENGQFLPIGFPVGALVGQAVSEPVIQTMLRGFHTGGAVSKSAVGFDRIEQLFEMPENLPGQATLAMAGGAVSKISPGIGGGWNVTVGDRNHFVPKELGLGIKKGDKVTPGQRLSAAGVIKPQDMLEATGDINRVRDQLIADLDKEYSSGGVKVRRKMFEAAIRPMTDRAEVLDAGDGEHHGIHRGDVLSINRIDEINKQIGKGRKIVFRSTLLPIRISPFKGEDFIGKLMFERPHETMREAPAVGATVNLAQGHPVTQFAMGVFRKK